jgi:hypothetical protein
MDNVQDCYSYDNCNNIPAVCRCDPEEECEFTSEDKLLTLLGFHGGDYEEWRLLGCYAVWFL